MSNRAASFFRSYFLLTALLVFGLLAFGYYLQYGKGIVPCPLCILQRFAYFAIGIFATIGVFTYSALVFRKLLSFLIGVASLAGGAVAARQIWLQHQPPKLFSECSSDLNYMLESLPLKDVFKKLFYATGDCAEVSWTLFGFSIAQWSVAVFSIVLLSSLVMLFKKQR